MSALMHLTAEGRRLLTEPFLRGEIYHWPDELLEPYLEPADLELSLDPLTHLIGEALTVFEPLHSALDQQLSPTLHEVLPLSRRQAAQPGLWRYLAVARYPELVRFRWGYPGRRHTANRFWRRGVRPDSNYLERLWWIAELLRGAWPDDRELPPSALRNDGYALVRVVLDRISLATALFVRTLSHFAPLARACVVELHDARSEIIEAVMRELGVVFSTLQLESHDEEMMRTIVRTLRRDFGG